MENEERPGRDHIPGTSGVGVVGGPNLDTAVGHLRAALEKCSGDLGIAIGLEPRQILNALDLGAPTDSLADLEKALAAPVPIRPNRKQRRAAERRQRKRGRS